MLLLRGVVFAAIVICARNAIAANDSPDSLKQRILAQARAVGPDDFAFTRTARVEQISEGKTVSRVVVERFDPAKAPGDRWTLISVEGRAPTAAELKQHRSEAPKRRVTSYGRLADYFAGASTTSTDDRGRTVFHFATLPKGTVVVADVDLSPGATADAVVDGTAPTPFVEQVRFTSNKPTRVKLVAKIEHFDATTRFRMLPDGRPVPIEQTSSVTGSTLGKSGHIRTTLIFSEHRAVSAKR